MNIIQELENAAKHLKEANKLAQDFRVRGMIANAATVVECARYLERKIAEGTEARQLVQTPARSLQTGTGT